MPGVETLLEFEKVAVELIDVGDSVWIALLLLLPAAAIPAAAAALESLGYWRDESRRFLSHGRRGRIDSRGAARRVSSARLLGLYNAL